MTRHPRSAHPAPPSETPPIPLSEPETVSPEVTALRQSWRFSAICAFMELFRFAVGYDRDVLRRGVRVWDVTRVERDLCSPKLGEEGVELVLRLLWSSTFNKSLSNENYVENLQQFLFRKNLPPLLGLDPANPIHPDDLNVPTRIWLIWLLTENHMASPLRLRQVMRSPEEEYWRQSPISVDSSGKEYWLIGQRLWTHVPVLASSTAESSSSEESSRESSPLSELSDMPSDISEQKPVPVSIARRQTRQSTIQKPSPFRRSQRGRKLRDEDGEWQSIPQEWLQEPVEETLNSTEEQENKIDSTHDDNIERTSEDKEEEHELMQVDVADEGNSDQAVLPQETTDVVKEDTEGQANVSNGSIIKAKETVPETTLEISITSTTPVESVKNEGVVLFEGLSTPDEQALPSISFENWKVPEETSYTPIKSEGQFIDPALGEWNTVCSCLRHWQDIQFKFANSKHKGEIKLHKWINTDAMTYIIQPLIQEAEKERLLLEEQIRMASLKRSTRTRKPVHSSPLVLYEDLPPRRPPPLTAAQIAAEKEEEDRKQREQLAAERLERTERRSKAPTAEERQIAALIKQAEIEAAKPKRPPPEDVDPEEYWLDCQVCGVFGKDLQDGREIACCEPGCGKWQHIECHDAKDVKNGKKKRNWKKIDFQCSQCAISRPVIKKPKKPRISKPKPDNEQSNVVSTHLTQQSVAPLNNGFAPINSTLPMDPKQMEMYRQYMSQYRPQVLPTNQFAPHHVSVPGMHPSLHPFMQHNDSHLHGAQTGPLPLAFRNPIYPPQNGAPTGQQNMLPVVQNMNQISVSGQLIEPGSMNGQSSGIQSRLPLASNGSILPTLYQTPPPHINTAPHNLVHINQPVYYNGSQSTHINPSVPSSIHSSAYGPVVTSLKDVQQPPKLDDANIQGPAPQVPVITDVSHAM